MPDGELKSAFRFNIVNVVESIKFLVMLECDPNKFSDDVSEEQKALLNIYKEIVVLPCVAPFHELKNMDKKRRKIAVLLLTKKKIYDIIGIPLSERSFFCALFSGTRRQKAPILREVLGLGRNNIKKERGAAHESQNYPCLHGMQAKKL
jgi:hypothetical protein